MKNDSDLVDLGLAMERAQRYAALRAELEAAEPDTKEWKTRWQAVQMAERTGLGPVANQPCTYCIGTDRYAARVVNVSKGGFRLAAMVYDGQEMEFTRRANGGYIAAGQNFGHLRFFMRETWLDPDFCRPKRRSS